MKISTKVMDRILFSVVVLFLLAPLTVFAANKVVVIPLFGDCPASVCNPLKNIVTVGKSNGHFTDPVAAVASITDASATNPYLVVIGPGVYTVTSPVVMKRYVDIAGSGENVTKITGAISTDDATSSVIVKMSDKSALSSLTVENTGGGGNSIALYNYNFSPKVSDVTAMASGGTSNIGVYNYSSSPVMTDVTATASGGPYNFGVFNLSSSPVMTNVSATASGGTNYGVYNYSSSPVMTNVSATASGVATNYGVYNFASSPLMTDVTALAGGGTSYAVYIINSSPVIRRSTMSGDTKGLYTESGTATVTQSTIKNGSFGGSNNRCCACDNGNGFPLTDNGCSPP